LKYKETPSIKPNAPRQHLHADERTTIASWYPLC